LSDSRPSPIIASDQEAGAQCRHCSAEIQLGDSLLVCPRCGAANHEACWSRGGGCGSYECAPVRRSWQPHVEPALRITAEDLAAAVPATRRHPPTASVAMSVAASAPPVQRLNRMAVASFVTAWLGIPLFGIVTGAVATVLACVAVGRIRQTRERGVVLALTGLLLGIADVVGWTIFLSLALTHPGAAPQWSDFKLDSTALDSLPPHIGRALRANVLIESNLGWGCTGVGSGVILSVHDGTAVVVTNRHIVDPDFSATAPARASVHTRGDRLQVALLNQPPQPGEIVWVAPDGIDLVLLSVPLHTANVQPASWQEKPRMAVGDEVFSIGNPQHLDWSHTRGVISQFRTQTCAARKIRIIQTDAAINPGNSGGGLYAQDGTLIGINTWTNDKRFSEGISFAIAFESFLDADPPSLYVPRKPGASPP
jgi:S1-C subfamily serine protease